VFIFRACVINTLSSQTLKVSHAAHSLNSAKRQEIGIHAIDGYTPISHVADRYRVVYEHLQTELIVVVPITSNVDRIFPRIEVKISLDGKIGKVVPRQIRAIDRTKGLGKKIGALSLEEMKSVDEAIRIILGLN
jgi:hypothetical protein